MLKKSLVIVVSVSMAVLAVSNSAVAQFGGLGSKKESAPAASGVDAAAMQEGLVRTYLAANRDVNAGLIEFAKAYGLKDQAASLEASANTLTGGSVDDQKALEENAKISSETQKAVEAKIAEGAVLSDEGKKHFVAGLVPFATGTKSTAALPKDLPAFSDAAKSQISSASLIEKAKVTKQLSTGVWLAKQVPGHVANLAKGLQQIVGFAQKNSIPIPAEATAALGN